MINLQEIIQEEFEQTIYIDFEKETVKVDMTPIILKHFPRGSYLSRIYKFFLKY